MLKVGLTGGIGASKTTVSDMFADLQVAVIDTDVLAHRLTEAGSPAYLEIVKTFGDEILGPDRRLDRSRLRDIVFSVPEKKTRLESILHPRIYDGVLQEFNGVRSAYCVVVVPLLLETGFRELVDRILVVDAPDEKRIPWIRARSGLTVADIRKILDAQMSREDRLQAADDVIVNDGEIDGLKHKVAELHRKYMAMADHY